MSLVPRSLVVIWAIATIPVASLAPPPVRSAFGDAALAVFGRWILPTRIEACGRDYNSGGPVVERRAQVEATYGTFPPVVSPWADSPCPGTTPAVVYVRAGPDAYVRYGLVGGV